MKDPRFILGALLMGMLFILAMALALGHVKEEDSAGLREVIVCFATMSGFFAGWAWPKSGT